MECIKYIGICRTKVREKAQVERVLVECKEVDDIHTNLPIYLSIRNLGRVDWGMFHLIPRWSREHNTLQWRSFFITQL